MTANPAGWAKLTGGRLSSWPPVCGKAMVVDSARSQKRCLCDRDCPVAVTEDLVPTRPPR
jgi:hypothetical protein